MTQKRQPVQKTCIEGVKAHAAPLHKQSGRQDCHLPFELGDNIHPTHYDLHFIFNSFKSLPEYQGIAVIHLTVRNPTSIIRLHCDSSFITIRKACICMDSVESCESTRVQSNLQKPNAYSGKSKVLVIDANKLKYELGSDGQIMEIDCTEPLPKGSHRCMLFFSAVGSQSPEGLYSVPLNLSELSCIYPYNLAWPDNSEAPPTYRNAASPPLLTQDTFSLKALQNTSVRLYTVTPNRKNILSVDHAKDEGDVPSFGIATFLEPLYARRVFPCFDLPNFKATFSIYVSYHHFLRSDPEKPPSDSKQNSTIVLEKTLDFASAEHGGHTLTSKRPDTSIQTECGAAEGQQYEYKEPISVHENCGDARLSSLRWMHGAKLGQQKSPFCIATSSTTHSGLLCIFHSPFNVCRQIWAQFFTSPLPVTVQSTPYDNHYGLHTLLICAYSLRWHRQTNLISSAFDSMQSPSSKLALGSTDMDEYFNAITKTFSRSYASATAQYPTFCFSSSPVNQIIDSNYVAISKQLYQMFQQIGWNWENEIKCDLKPRTSKAVGFQWKNRRRDGVLLLWNNVESIREAEDECHSLFESMGKVLFDPSKSYKRYASPLESHCSTECSVSSDSTSPAISCIRTISFQQSPPLPPYGISLFIGPFHATAASLKLPVYDSSAQIDDEASAYKSIDILVWSLFNRPAHLREFATKQSILSFSFFHNLLPSLAYPGRKLDLIALPKNAGLGLENFGCISFKERYLLLSSMEAMHRQLRVARLICHEISHLWFGNLITPACFGLLFLKEGFARYLEFVAVKAIEPEYQSDLHFLLDVFAPILTSDSADAHDIAVIGSGLASVKAVHDMYNDTVYAKGACLLKMLEGFVGWDAIRNIINSLIFRSRHSTVQMSDFYSSVMLTNHEVPIYALKTQSNHLTEHHASAYTLEATESIDFEAAQPNATLQTVEITDWIHYWLTTPGFPRLFVSIIEEEKVICLRQERRLRLPNRRNRQGNNNVEDKESPVWPILLKIRINSALKTLYFTHRKVKISCKEHNFTDLHLVLNAEYSVFCTIHYEDEATFTSALNAFCKGLSSYEAIGFLINLMEDFTVNRHSKVEIVEAHLLSLSRLITVVRVVLGDTIYKDQQITKAVAALLLICYTKHMEEKKVLLKDYLTKIKSLYKEALAVLSLYYDAEYKTTIMNLISPEFKLFVNDEFKAIVNVFINYCYRQKLDE